MRRKMLTILIAGAAFVVCTSLTYIYVKKKIAKEKLAQLNHQYREGLKVVYDKDNPFCLEPQLAFYDSILTVPYTSENRILVVQFFRAFTLVKMGDEKKAIDVLESIVEKTKAKPSNKLVENARDLLALAYLRLGERNNCISGHTSGSCIFPIQGKGVYTDPTASQKGIKMYQESLQENPDNLEARWLLNVAYMTLGEYPAKVPSKWLIPGLDTDTSSYQVKAFPNMAGGLKLGSYRTEAGGSIVDDFNNDGYLDIVTSSWDLEDGMHYFRNNGDGTFTDVSKKSGLSEIKGGLNIIQADYNNDGFVDIYLLRGAWLGEFGRQPGTLLRNNGDGTFTDVTVESGILSFHPSQTATWADFNNDGWLDLFIGNESMSPDHPHPSELFINNQDGTFTNIAGQAGCEMIQFTKGVTAGDYNNDGWPDIFMSGRDGREILLKNKAVKSRIPQFEDATHEAGLDREPIFTFPTWFWDYDNDGWPDIFVCGYKFEGSLSSTAAAEALNLPLGDVSRMYLYRNNHDGTFTDVSKNTGLDHPVFAMGSNFGDIDNDGWLDMYLGTGNPDFTSLVPNRMFKNIDGQKFVEVTNSARVGNLQKGHGVAFADVDNDGDQDIFAVTGGAFKGDGYFNSFYVNPGQNNNNWISIQLEGVHSNRSAIGAHIVVTFTEDGAKRTVYRDVNSGGSFGSSPFRKEIGIGRAKMIDELIIKWPTTGIVQDFKNVTPCQFLRIREGSDKVEKMNLKVLRFNGNDSMHMDMSLIECGPHR